MTGGSSLRRYAYTTDNRLMTAGNNRYTHDKQGFRSIWNAKGKYTLYKYAQDYQLLEVTLQDEDTTFSFTHDENGQRAEKLRNGEPFEAYKWLDFIRLAAFHDGEIGYEFAYNEEERTPFALRRAGGAIGYLYYDQIGSLRVVADTSGNVIKEILYDPFGGIIEDTNPDLRIPIGYAGGLHDRDLGFVRFGWRDYDTLTSRWTAPDPIGDAGGDPDWYGYCLDDPVNGVDPLGLAVFIASAVAAGMAFAPHAARISSAVARGVRAYGPTVKNYAINAIPTMNRLGNWLTGQVKDGSPDVVDRFNWAYDVTRDYFSRDFAKKGRKGSDHDPKGDKPNTGSKQPGDNSNSGDKKGPDRPGGYGGWDFSNKSGGQSFPDGNDSKGPSKSDTTSKSTPNSYGGWGFGAGGYDYNGGRWD